MNELRYINMIHNHLEVSLNQTLENEALDFLDGEVKVNTPDDECSLVALPD